MFVKPREGLVVRDPSHKRPLPAEGAHVPDVSYWRRRRRDGDVILMPEPEAANEAARPAAQE